MLVITVCQNVRVLTWMATWAASTDEMKPNERSITSTSLSMVFGTPATEMFNPCLRAQQQKIGECMHADETYLKSTHPLDACFGDHVCATVGSVTANDEQHTDVFLHQELQ